MVATSALGMSLMEAESAGDTKAAAEDATAADGGDVTWLQETRWWLQKTKLRLKKSRWRLQFANVVKTAGTRGLGEDVVIDGICIVQFSEAQQLFCCDLRVGWKEKCLLSQDLENTL